MAQFPNGVLGAVLRLFSLLVLGLAFGWLFERSHVYEPDSIRQQFIFAKNIMLKMFMGAVAGACVSFFIWDRMITGGAAVLAKIRRDQSCGSPAVPVAVFGGAVLGVGMVVAGACPGMVLPQVGSFSGRFFFSVVFLFYPPPVSFPPFFPSLFL